MLPKCQSYAIRPIFIQLYRKGNEKKRIEQFYKLDDWVIYCHSQKNKLKQNSPNQAIVPNFLNFTIIVSFT